MSRKRNRGGACIPDPEGYQYGVRFKDGSIAHGWSGRTQLDRCQEFIYVHAKLCNGERLTLVRRDLAFFSLWGFHAPWEHVDIDPWRTPLTNYVRTPDPAAPMTHYGRKVRYVWRGRFVASSCARTAMRLWRNKVYKGEHA